jgi:hypothetical protein
MLREHDGKMWIREGGYWEEVEHINRMADLGEPPFFKGYEWLDYFTIRVIEEYVYDEEVPW